MITNFYKNQVIQICSEYAGVAHIGQFRKDKKTPYITHPARVAHMVSQFLDGSKAYLYVAAGWLHDVMEDCSVIMNGDYSTEIKNHSNGNKDIYKFLTTHDIISPADAHEIFRAVDALSMSQDKSSPKKERKKSYYRKLIRSGQGPVLVKACDRIDNLLTANVFSQQGFKWYLQDTANMMEVLGDDIKSISPEAYEMLEKTLEEGTAQYEEMYK